MAWSEGILGLAQGEGDTGGVSAQPKAGPLSTWKGKGKARVAPTPSFFLPEEAVVPTPAG